MKTKKYLDISTGHILKRDVELLNKLDSQHRSDDVSLGCTIAVYPEGFFVSVIKSYKKEVLQELWDCGFSDEFVYLYEKCVDNGIGLIRFDRDGEISNEFPFYNW